METLVSERNYVNLSAPDLVSHIKELRARGLSQKQISLVVGVSRRTVGRRLNGDLRVGNLQHHEKRQQRRRAEMVLVKVDGGRKHVKAKKRPYSPTCEMCGCPDSKWSKSHHWHHWDDSKPEQGLWLCNYMCHTIAEGVEKGIDVAGLVRKYEELKSSIIVGG